MLFCQKWAVCHNFAQFFLKYKYSAGKGRNTFKKWGKKGQNGLFLNT